MSHAQAPAPVSSVPQPPPGSLAARLLQPMPELDPREIGHARTERQAMPAVIFEIGDEPPRLPVVAFVAPAISELLTDLQHNRLAALLEVPSQDWIGTQMTLDGDQRVQLAYDIDDPQSTPGGQPARIHLQLDITLNAARGGNDVLEAVVIGPEEAPLVLPAREARRFVAPDEQIRALVPHARYTQQQEQALAAQSRVRQFVHGPHGRTAHYTFWVRGGDGAPAMRFQAAVALRRDPVLNAWAVAGVRVEAALATALQVQPACFEWLARGVRSPGLPGEVVEAIQFFVRAHNGGDPLPPVVRFNDGSAGPRLHMNVWLRAPDSQALAHWELRVSFAAHGEHHLIARVDVQRSPTQGQAREMVYLRPNVGDWVNPETAHRHPDETSTVSSVPTSGTVREHSPDPSQEERQVRRRRDGSPSNAAPTARELREQQAVFQMLALQEAPYQASTPPPGGSPAGSVSPVQGTSTAGAPPPGDLFMTEDAYRQRHGLAAGTPVCPAIAAGVVLRRHVPFATVLQTLPHAGREASDAAQMRRLLAALGAGTVASASFDQMLGDDARSVAQGLQQHLQHNGHDAAVLLYRLDSRPGDPTGFVRGHHVSIYLENGQWQLHDGRRNGGLPQAMTLDQIVAATFGQNTQGAGELQVLSLARPAPAGTAAPATIPAPAPEAPSEEEGASPPASGLAGPDAPGHGEEANTQTLRLSPSFQSRSTSPWRRALYTRGFRIEHLPHRGSRGDFDQVARDIVDACNRHPTRVREPQGNTVRYTGVPLPAWNTAGTPMAGLLADAELTVNGDEVTDIALANVRPAPIAVRVQGRLSLATAVVDIEASLHHQMVGFTTLHEALPRRGIRGVDWTLSTQAILRACEAAGQGTQIGTDRNGLPIVEFTGLEIAGVPTTVLLRLHDMMAGQVLDMRIIDPSQPAPTINWF